MLTFSLEMTIGMLAVIFKERIFSRQSTIDFVLLLQNEYGIHSSFTAAVDLAQTKVSFQIFNFRFFFVLILLNFSYKIIV